jgi:hypothetical protein
MHACRVLAKRQLSGRHSLVTPSRADLAGRPAVPGTIRSIHPVTRTRARAACPRFPGAGQGEPEPIAAATSSSSPPRQRDRPRERTRSRATMSCTWRRERERPSGGAARSGLTRAHTPAGRLLTDTRSPFGDFPRWGSRRFYSPTAGRGRREPTAARVWGASPCTRPPVPRVRGRTEPRCGRLIPCRAP